MKKILALLTAIVMAVSLTSTTAFAAGTFTEIEKNLLEKQLAEYAEKPVKEPSENGHMGINIKLGETGRALIGMFTELDAAWLDNLDLAIDTTLGEKTQVGKATLSLNGTALAVVNFELDLETMDMLFAAPELSDGVLKANYTELMNISASAAGETEGEALKLTAEQYAELMRITRNLSKNPPSKDVVTTILRRYATIAIDAYQDGEVGTDSYEINGITQEADTAEGFFAESSALEMVRTILTTAKEDEEIRGILTSGASETAEGPSIYETFTGIIDSALEELDKEAEDDDEEDEGGKLVLKIWVDENEECVGTQLTTPDMYDGPTFTWRVAKDGDVKALDASSRLDTDVAFTLQGQGETAEGVFAGAYELAMNDTPMLSIDVSQTDDKEATRNGQFEGTYTFNPITDAENEENPMNSFAGFSATASVLKDGNDGLLTLDLVASGSSLGLLSLRSSDGEGVEIPAWGEKQYALTDSDALNEFIGTVDPTPFFTHLTEAGMPDGFLEAAMEKFSGSSSEEEMGVTEEADDYADEEEPAA